MPSLEYYNTYVHIPGILSTQLHQLHLEIEMSTCNSKPTTSTAARADLYPAGECNNYVNYWVTTTSTWICIYNSWVVQLYPCNLPTGHTQHTLCMHASIAYLRILIICYQRASVRSMGYGINPSLNEVLNRTILANVQIIQMYMQQHTKNINSNSIFTQS